MIRSEAKNETFHRTALRLSLLFALIYFVQGLAEPSEGLIAQPVRSLLGKWNQSAGQVAQFMAIAAAPWTIKPLYGLMIDFVPFLRSRRRKYLLLSTAITAVSLLWLSIAVPASGATLQLLILLVIPTTAVAFSDVVIDALMIEKGQPLGLTGRLQSIQWGAMYAATVLAGSLGGWMAQHNRQDLGFLICGLGALASFVAAWFWIHDDRSSESELTASNGLAVGLKSADGQSDRHSALLARLRLMQRTFKNSQFQIVAAFIFLWNFNPFSSTIQQLHMTGQLKLSEQQYGHTISLFSIGAIGACIIYGFVCRRLPVGWLIHLAIMGGVLSTLAYLLADSVTSAFVVSITVGFAYMAGNLIQMDIAARMCPPEIAGSMFALLMSISNIAVIGSTSLGGWIYEWIADQSGATVAYAILIWIGAGATALCWALVPWLRSPW